MFWIDRSSESSNVVVVTDTAIVIGSCDEEHCDQVEQQLSANRSPLEVLGTDDILSIPYSQIQRITSRSTDTDVDIHYRAKKDVEEKSVFFEDVESKQRFVDALDSVLPGELQKSEVKQSAFGASLSPLLSLILSGFATYLFIDKFRWPAIIVGGLWAVGSAFTLVRRAASPPTVTRWTIGGRYVRKAWNGLKTAVSYVILAAIIAVGHDAVPDAYGEKSLYQQMVNLELDADEVETFLDRGADINLQDADGDTALSLALYWDEDDVAVALIEAGADLTKRDSSGMTPIEYAVSYGSNVTVTSALLENGASLDFEIDGMSPLEFANYNEYDELKDLLLAQAN
ncbi:MAG: ankyrin repeat domain-containing protein [Pseudomonadota bacterium]